MTLYLPSESFAYEQLRLKSLDVRTDDEAPHGTIETLFVNPMFFPRSAEVDWFEHFARSKHNVRVTLVIPDAYVDSDYFKELSTDDAAYVKATYIPWLALKRTFRQDRLDFDGALFAGAGFECTPFEDLPTYDSFVKMFEWSYVHSASTLFSCYLANVAYSHFYGIKAQQRGEKLFDVYSQQLLANPRFPISRRLCEKLKTLTPLEMPASRLLFREPSQLSADTDIVLSSFEAGATLFVTHRGDEKSGKEMIFLEDHPESARVLLDVYNHCNARYLAQKTNRKPRRLPTRQVIPANGGAPEAPWLPIGQTIVDTWLERLFEARLAKLQLAA